jgi:hypothetical protein
MIVKDGTLEYTPENTKSRTKIAFSPARHLIKSTDATIMRSVRLRKLSNNHRVYKKNRILDKKKWRKKRANRYYSESSFDGCFI